MLFDTPEKGWKSFVAGATVRSSRFEEMTAGDYQSRLFDADECTPKESESSDTGNNEK